MKLTSQQIEQLGVALSNYVRVLDVLRSHFPEVAPDLTELKMQATLSLTILAEPVKPEVVHV